MDESWPPTWPKIETEHYIFDPWGDVLLILKRHPPEINEEHVNGDEIHSEAAVKCRASSQRVEGQQSFLDEPLPEKPALDEAADDEEESYREKKLSLKKKKLFMKKKTQKKKPKEVILEEEEEAPYEEAILEETASEERTQHWLPAEPFAYESPDVPKLGSPELDTTDHNTGSELGIDARRPASSHSSGSASSWPVKPFSQKVHMRVSSKHLILASATFRTSLGSDSFPEGRKLRTEGNVVIPLDDEDPDTMIILLYVIHGLTRKVPQEVSLGMLSRIASVVNHRKMHEAVEHFSNTWIEKLGRKPLPKTYEPKSEVLSWLFIFWVFQKEDGFQKMSQILERESDHSLDSEVENGFLLPASIIGTIQQKRLSSIKAAIQTIHDLIAKYSAPKVFCRRGLFSCDCLLLGSLLKSSAAIEIIQQPTSPYAGVTFKKLATEIREMKVLDNGSPANKSYYYETSSCDGHGIKDLIEASIESLEDGMCGLKLQSFLPR